MTRDPWQELCSSLPETHRRRKRKKRRTVCGRCGVLMHLRGRTYVCPADGCNGNHSSHEDGTPVGYPADRDTCEARRRAHQAFDVLWKSKKMSRHEAYAVMRKVLRMTISEAHIGRFNASQCEALINKLKELGEKVYEL